MYSVWKYLISYAYLLFSYDVGHLHILCCRPHLRHVSMIFTLQAPQRMDNHGGDAQDNLKVKRPLHRLVDAIVHAVRVNSRDCVSSRRHTTLR